MKLFRLVKVLLLSALLLVAAPEGWCQKPVKIKAPPPKEPAPTELAPEQIDPYLAGLTDAQARKVLGQVLKEGAAERVGKVETESSMTPIARIFFGATEKVAGTRAELSRFFTSASGERGRAREFFETITEQRGWGLLLKRLAEVGAIIALGGLLRRLFRRRTAGLNERLLSSVRLGRAEYAGRLFTRLLLEIGAAAVYMLTTFVLFVLFFQPGDTGYGFVASYLVVSYYVVAIGMISQVVFSPGAPGLRLFPMPDENARFFHRWLLWISISAGVVVATAGVFNRLGGTRGIYLLLYSLAGVVVILSLIVMVWQKRVPVAQALAGEGRGAPIRLLFARSWHWLAMLYILWMGVDWVAGVILEERLNLLNMILSVFIIPVFIGLDQWGQRLLKIAAREAPPPIPLTGYPEAESGQAPGPDSRTGLRNYVPQIRVAFRWMVLAFAFFLVLQFWGIDLPLGRIFTEKVLSVIVMVVLGVIAWEVVKARIDRKLKEDSLTREEGEGEEGGGPGGSRSATLLLLLRKFILAVLFVVVSLITLSSIGVDIAPLIAGAGVVGLAIGFGSQTLVKDIIAGLFFLSDDAFRIGDYVEAGAAKGTVVHMSLRSLKLRHPRGMLYTVPFGDLKTVTNFSRDYIITKLDVRVRFDADLEKVRKIIKKINKEIMQDEENRAALLSDIKSTGVREIDDSAMIVRIKFKTIPGKQFILRREIFARLQKAFHASGIEFAHRNVTVYIPPMAHEGETHEQERQRIEAAAGGAAAAAIAQAEAEELAKAKPEKK